VFELLRQASPWLRRQRGPLLLGFSLQVAIVGVELNIPLLWRRAIDGAIGRELFPVMATLLAHLVLVDRHMQEKLSGVRT